VQAEIYKSKNDKGEWVYSDKPSADAERMKLPPLSTYTPAPIKQPSVSDADREQPDDTYKSMVFVAPVNDATVRDNQGIVRASVKLDPLLMDQQGHKIQFYLDGTPYGIPVAGSNLVIKNLDRGSHALGARVLNASGKSLFSADPVTCFIRRESVNFPNRVKPTPTPRKVN
ncbi:MAG: hypothetical protein KAJ73_06305, partial [Zetaproteobacteria bacterium]|nr:hypothetical protein [Zetaproteobacteria bacterium]